MDPHDNAPPPPAFLPPDPVAEDAQGDADGSPRKRRRRVVSIELTPETEALALIAGQDPAEFARGIMAAVVTAFLRHVRADLNKVPK